MSRYVSNQHDLIKLMADLRGSEILAIDTEFLREKTYYAKLCLVQVNNGSIKAIIDPLSVKDLSVMSEILQDKNCTKIFHSGSQDVDVLYHATGVMPSPVFDTQIAAALLGHPLQVGYGPLVRSMCGVRLAKADSYTDWSRRPLTENQIKYALDDVVYLPRMYREMVDKLSEEGRLHWLDADFEHLIDVSRYENAPEEMWRKVKRVSSLSRAQLAITQQVAAWREREAMTRNLPRKWILPDEAVVEIARKAPRTSQALLEVRGLNTRLSKQAVAQILAAVETALNMPQSEYPKLPKHPHGNAEIDGAVDMMAAIVEIRSRQNNVAVPVLASRDDLTRLARGHRSDNAVLKGWRYEMVGKELLDLLDGKLSLYLDNGSIKVAPRHTS